MAHKSRSRTPPDTPAPLLSRIHKARLESRFQNALELARQLYKHEPSEQTVELLRQVSVERARQLESQGYVKDAATIYANAADMGGPEDFRRLMIEKLAVCGAVDKAASLAQALGDPRLLARLQGFVADAALVQGPRGQAQLPPEQHADHDAIVQAFAHAEAGRDDEARAVLQAIGLQSPFLEWRVFLRGLLAYYANDDARAVENWQRLDPQRLPSKLAAPFRFGVDPAYRTAQPPATQTSLQKRLDAMGNIPLVSALRRLQPLLTHENKRAQIFRDVEALLPALRQEYPDLVPRLVDCVRWSIIQHGQPDDLDRFERVFGVLPDDPNLARLAAMAQERRGMWLEAFNDWIAFEKEVANDPSCWPGEQARHVRALVLSHAGSLAVQATLPDLDDFAMPRQPQVFKPCAEQCFRRSLKLAPEMLSTHQMLLALCVQQRKMKEALQVGQKLLERFPDQVETLQVLAGVAEAEYELDLALTYLQRAQRINPLDQGLRQRLMNLHERRARDFSCKRKFDEARTDCQAALALSEQAGKYLLLAVAAVIELKAKNDDPYQQFLAQMHANIEDPLAVAYALQCEAIRQKIPAAQRKAFAADFEAQLQKTLTATQVSRLAGVASVQRREGRYQGQKNHEKKVLAIVDKHPLKDCPEERLENLCVALTNLEAKKPLTRVIGLGKKRFPDNPTFLLAEAEYNMKAGKFFGASQIQATLGRVRKLIEQFPRGQRQEAYLEKVGELENMLRDFFTGSPFGELMNQFMGFDYEDDDDDDYG